MNKSAINPIQKIITRIQELKAQKIERQRIKTLTKELIDVVKNPDEDAVKKIKYLVRQGANVNTFDMSKERSLVHFAAEQDRLDVVKALIECGCKKYINFYDSSGKDPAFYAIDHNNPEMLDYLLSHGVSTMRPGDFSYESSFRYAVRSGHTKLVEIELKHGADINDHVGEHFTQYNKYERFYPGPTPLAEVTSGREVADGLDGNMKKYYDKKMIVFLLQKGARTDIKNEYGNDVNYLWNIPEIKNAVNSPRKKQSTPSILKKNHREY